MTLALVGKSKRATHRYYWTERACGDIIQSPRRLGGLNESSLSYSQGDRGCPDQYQLMRNEFQDQTAIQPENWDFCRVPKGSWAEAGSGFECAKKAIALVLAPGQQ